MANTVFMGISLDGYIADKDGGLDWLNRVPNPDKDDCGFAEFMSGIDALVMGRSTFEVVDGFGVEWPYIKPVYVLSSSLKRLHEKYQGKAELINVPIDEINGLLAAKGHTNLYIDGGSVVQQFLRKGLVDVIRLFRMPVLLGGGTLLFADLPQQIDLEHVETKVHLGAIVESRYKCKKQ